MEIIKDGRDKDWSMTLGCPSCGSVLRAASGDLKSVTEFSSSIEGKKNLETHYYVACVCNQDVELDANHIPDYLKRSIVGDRCARVLDIQYLDRFHLKRSVIV